MALHFLPLQKMIQAIIAPDSMVSETKDMMITFDRGRGVSGPGRRSKKHHNLPTTPPILNQTVSNIQSTSKVHVSPPSSPVLLSTPGAQIAKGKNRGSSPYRPFPSILADLNPTQELPYGSSVAGASGASEPALPMSDIDYAIALQIEEIETAHETFADEEMARMLDAGADIPPRLPRYNLRPRQSGKVSTAGGDTAAKQQDVSRIVHECTSCFDELDHLVGLRSACGHFYCFTCVRNMVNTSMEGDSFPPKCCSQPLMGTFANKADGDAQIKLLGLVMDDPDTMERMEVKWREISVNPIDRVYCSKPECSEFLGSAIELMKGEGPSCSGSASPSSSSAPHFLRRFTTPKSPPVPLTVPVDAGKCPKCQFLTCILCRQPEHGSQSCSERLDVQFWDLVKEKQWKKCPECRAVVEKNGGCNSVRCRCGRGFTY